MNRKHYPMLARLGALGASCMLLATAPAAHATPLISSRVGGLTLVGPAIRHPASMCLNPATLGLFRGHHLLFQGEARLDSASITRTGVSAASGTANGPPHPEEKSQSITPQVMAVAISDLDLEGVAFGLMAHTPTWQNRSILVGTPAPFFDGDAQTPSAYHGTHLRLQHLLLTLGVAVEFAENWHVGISASYAFGWLEFGFVRDVALDGGAIRDSGETVALDDCGNGDPCGYEAARAAEAIRISGTSAGLGFAAGIVGKLHPDVTIGIGYASPIWGLGSTTLSTKGDAWVRRATATVDAAGNGFSRDAQGRGVVSYNMPDTFSAGVAWRLNQRWLLDFQLRWMLFSRHDRLDIRLGGQALQRTPAVPGQIVHHRGFVDVINGQVGAVYTIRRWLNLQGGIMLESSAVPREKLNSMAIDGFKLDAFLGVVLSMAPLTVRLGYGIIFVPSISPGKSTFDPRFMTECVDGWYDVDLQACKNAATGRGLASGLGEYGSITHRLGGSVGFDWD